MRIEYTIRTACAVILRGLVAATVLLAAILLPAAAAAQAPHPTVAESGVSGRDWCKRCAMSIPRRGPALLPSRARPHP